MKDFEGLFGEFIDGKEYDKAEVEIYNGKEKESLFEIVRAAFLAGWTAAGGGEIRASEDNADSDNQLK